MRTLLFGYLTVRYVVPVAAYVAFDASGKKFAEQNKKNNEAAKAAREQQAHTK